MPVARYAMLITVLVGCSPEYPSCPVATEQDSEYLPPEGGEHDGPGTQDPGSGDPGWPTWPSGDGLADDEGYKRLGDGQVCRCDMSDPLCSREEPKVVSSDADCNVKEPNDPDCIPQRDSVCINHDPLDPDCQQHQPQPQTPSICGEVYWCCYVIECIEHATETAKDVMLCPKHYGWANTRYNALHLWVQNYVRPERVSMRKKHGTKACYILGANCREEPGAATCGFYPAD